MPDEASRLSALYTIFEKHLYAYEEDEADESESAFVDKIVNDYLRFLCQQHVAVPLRWQKQIVDELRDQVRKMLVKKTYGCLSIKEFVARTENVTQVRKETKKKFGKLF